MDVPEIRRAGHRTGRVLFLGLTGYARSLGNRVAPGAVGGRAFRAGRSGIPRLSALHRLRAQLLRTAHRTRSLGELIDELSGETGRIHGVAGRVRGHRFQRMVKTTSPSHGTADRAPAPIAFRSPGRARGGEPQGLQTSSLRPRWPAAERAPRAKSTGRPGSRLDLPGRPPALGDEFAAAIRSAAADVRGSPAQGPSGQGGHSRGLSRRSEDGRRDETGTRRLLARRGRGPKPVSASGEPLASQ